MLKKKGLSQRPIIVGFSSFVDSRDVESKPPQPCHDCSLRAIPFASLFLKG